MDSNFLYDDDESLNYEAIPVSSLVIDSRLSFDIYIKVNTQNKFLKLAGADISLSRATVDEFKSNNLFSVYVKKEQRKEYGQYIQKHLAEIAAGGQSDFEEKAKIVYDIANDIMQELFANPIAPGNIAKSKDVANVVLDKIMTDNRAFFSILKISSYDYHTYSHCVHTSVYSIRIAKELGFDKDMVRAVGEAAILHDVGKSRIPNEVLNKEGPLSQEEFEIMKNHTVFGYDILKETKEGDGRILDGVKHHHEKLNGSGYPDGLIGVEISETARIIAVADVFDALTTRRSYKEPLSSFQALRLMRTKMEEHLDIKVIDAFISAMQIKG